MMINSLCGSTGSLKSESCCSKLLPTSSNDSWVLESKTTSTLTSGFEQNGLTPSSLNFPCLKFEEMEVQSPENSLWESFFCDQLDGGDFMISSPVRNTLPSPQGTNFNYNYVHQPMHGWSPPRASSPLGHYSSTNNKGKGLSPLHRVFNTSPNNNQFMQVESLSLPALENFLDDYEKENEFLSINKSSSSEYYDALTTVPALLDCLTMPNSSRFCGPETSAHGGSSKHSQESDVYQMRSMGTTPAPLLQLLQEERQQEKQKQQHPPPHTAQQLQQAQNIDNTLMIPLCIAPEQEHDSGLQLVHLLLACAEAVAREDYMLARRYLHHLNRVVTPLGDSMQRVASCFTDALSARLAATLTTKPTTSNSKPFTPFPPDSQEIFKIYQILYQACPYIKFAHFTANQAIFEAFEFEERVHVIDLDIRLPMASFHASPSCPARRPAFPPDNRSRHLPRGRYGDGTVFN